MKRTFATYEHSTIGFPKVVLKWGEENNVMDAEARVVINGIVQPQMWKFTEQNSAVSVRIDFELKRFDDWVRGKFADRPEVQG